MSNKKKFFYAVFASLLLIAFVANKTMPKRSTSRAVAERAKARELAASNTETKKPPTTPGERAVNPKAQDVDKEFLRWFSMEARRVEAREVDTLATEAELKNRASHFRHQEINYLASRASSVLVPATERMLASYMLGLAGDASSQALVDIASRPVDNPGPHPAHSVDEARTAQERAYKIMAVDAIYQGQSEVSQKINKLQAIVNQTPDATIKKYALSKVGELHAHY